MILDVKNLTMRFGGLVAINDLSFSVEEGEIFSIIGPNGAGKTTMLNCLSRYYTPQEGSIHFNGVDLLKKRVDQVLGVGLGRSFQNVELCKRLPMLDNIMLGNDYRLRSSFFANMLSLGSARRDEANCRQEALRVIEMLNLTRFVNDRVSELPFGTQKRVDMARCLVSRPKMLLLDEPVAGANPQEKKEIAGIIRRLNEEEGITILMIEHDMPFVMDLSHRVMAMDFGSKIAEGDPTTVQNNPQVIEAYLGEEDE